jgi:hypothetical protein
MGDQKQAIMALGISMPVLAIISVALRYHARLIKRMKLGIDDYTIFIGLVRDSRELLASDKWCLTTTRRFLRLLSQWMYSSASQHHR